METDYHKIGVSVAETIAKIDKPLTMDQRMFLVGAISPWLKQRDDRIAELEKSHQRYEKMRRLSPQAFQSLWTESLAGERFDDLVDRLGS
jgi:hypothetical protein